MKDLQVKNLHMKERGYPGFLFTFCGLDGCGKTSMIKRLTQYLQSRNIKPVLTKQPTEAVRQSPIFRTYMNSPDHEAYSYRSLSLLAASDRIQHTEKEIEPALKNGSVVISDRYFYSCLANLRARGFVKDRWLYEIAQFIVKPSISFFLDVPVETAVKRVRQREEEKERYIDMELQYRLREEYLKIAETVGGVVVRTGQTEEESFQMVVKWINRRLHEEKVKEDKGKLV